VILSGRRFQGAQTLKFPQRLNQELNENEEFGFTNLIIINYMIVIINFIIIGYD
jgi:hypothetical protein